MTDEKSTVQTLQEGEPAPAGARRERPTNFPTYLHRIGGRDRDGSQSVVSRWTFEAEQIRAVVENHLRGRVLNATAGRTELEHETVVRNDINPEIYADTHIDVAEIDQHFPDNTFDVAILDPPFDDTQAEKRYAGWHASEWSASRQALEPILRPGATVIQLGWTSYGMAEQFSEWHREELHIYQRGPVHPDVFLTVDRQHQATLGGMQG